MNGSKAYFSTMSLADKTQKPNGFFKELLKNRKFFFKPTPTWDLFIAVCLVIIYFSTSPLLAGGGKKVFKNFWTLSGKMAFFCLSENNRIGEFVDS